MGWTRFLGPDYVEERSFSTFRYLTRQKKGKFPPFPLDKLKINAILDRQALYLNQVEILQHIAAIHLVNAGLDEVRPLRAISLLSILLILGNLLVLGLFIIA